MNAEFKLTPEAKAFVMHLVTSSTRYKPAVDKAIQKIAESCAEDVKRKIYSQDFPNVRLSAAYRERKAREGLDTRTLIATQKYAKSIRAQQVEQGVWGVVCQDTEQARRLEYGTRGGSPPRPHWTPVITEYESKFSDRFAAMVMQDIMGGYKL
jgi:hypothetical protein